MVTWGFVIQKIEASSIVLKMWLAANLIRLVPAPGTDSIRLARPVTSIASGTTVGYVDIFSLLPCVPEWALEAARDSAYLQAWSVAVVGVVVWSVAGWVGVVNKRPPAPGSRQP